MCQEFWQPLPRKECMSPPYLHQDDNLLGSEMGRQLTEEIKQIDYMGAAMSDQPYPTLNSSFFSKYTGKLGLHDTEGGLVGIFNTTIILCDSFLLGWF